MTEPIKQPVEVAKTVEEKIKAVNKILQDGDRRISALTHIPATVATNHSLLSMP